MGSRWLSRYLRRLGDRQYDGSIVSRLPDAVRSTRSICYTAELLATGERASAALLGIALDRAGVAARVVSPREIRFRGDGHAARRRALRDSMLAGVGELLHAAPVLVVPGFFGTDPAGRTHCLGREGSDLTAVFLAVSLYARCRLIKDVDGVYEFDPADPGAHPRRLAQLSYENALQVAGKLIQPKAVAYLERHRATCEVAALASPTHSYICAGPTLVAEPPPLHEGLPKAWSFSDAGMVGFRVVSTATGKPRAAHDVLGVAVHDRKKHEATRRSARTPAYTKLRDSPDAKASAGNRCAARELSPSFELVVHYLSEGVDVVTANKAVIARGRHRAHPARGSLQSGAAVLRRGRRWRADAGGLPAACRSRYRP